MKRIILLLLILSLSANCQKETHNNFYSGFDLAKNNSLANLHRSWLINVLITDSEFNNEYLLIKPKAGERLYGNSLTLNPNGTFRSAYSAECGNDCFTTTSGKYKIISENYICFYLEKIDQEGDCNGHKEPNKDLGIFYIHKGENEIRLIKSDGDQEQDKLNVSYSDKIDFLKAEMDSMADRFSVQIWMELSFGSKSMKSAVQTAMTNFKIDNYKIVFYKPSYDGTDILIKAADGFHYLMFNGRSIAFYNDAPIRAGENLVAAIKAHKDLKEKTAKESSLVDTKVTNPANSITVYKQGNEIVKIKYFQIYERKLYNDETTTLYLKNGVPLYAEIETNYIQISDQSATAIEQKKVHAVNQFYFGPRNQIIKKSANTMYQPSLDYREIKYLMDLSQNIHF
ncbi:hypothetical protein [Flavobacterium sp.]|uniref:hypothetical protein n=1 Tax=Flavobacterium sp. TaxID=239 RepID=UPI00248891F1|nr:hypothetical protein [Flavobacterium sp.]MDI1317790.1 hypothetical protein [Flavobacterium sp.]